MGIRVGMIGLLALALQGCASGPDISSDPLPVEQGQRVVRGPENAGKGIQCVPYARLHSGVNLFGDASTWWDEAEGRYRQGNAPEKGAVMVLDSYSGSNHGHVAVVRDIVSTREIRVDHANWLNDGAVYLNDPVADVSADNDWSAVKVFNIKAGAWGIKVYPVKGFIAPGAAPRKPRHDPADRIALATQAGNGSADFSGQ